MAADSENTASAQPRSTDISLVKKPMAERGPNEIMAIRQPASTITPGVRQPGRDAETVAGRAAGAGVAVIRKAPENGRRNNHDRPADAMHGPDTTA
ncbi:hypothetical protein BLTE_01400 [Blastochloris tepida]|uniref:Uncharacterized protein n=1 Tax=Blastochloris tepida TaxID=2233851 RepID=A0A348FVX2_9HYPH|nr:hypothetical protein BLTE_01400 [Blastochloris tepida]